MPAYWTKSSVQEPKPITLESLRKVFEECKKTLPSSPKISRVLDIKRFNCEVDFIMNQIHPGETEGGCAGKE